MNTVKCTAGRLVELRIRPAEKITSNVSGVDAVGDEMRGVMTKISARGEQAIVVVDYTRMRVVTPDVSDRMIALMGRLNPRVLRSAVLMPSLNATARLQQERIVRAAGSPNRRVFERAIDLETWLAEVLSPAERTRLHEFLEESSR